MYNILSKPLYWSYPFIWLIIIQSQYPLLQKMWKIRQKCLMNIRKYIPFQILARCILGNLIVFMHKLELFFYKPSFNLLLIWVPWFEHPLLILHSLHCPSQQVPSSLFFWVLAGNKTICWMFGLTRVLL